MPLRDPEDSFSSSIQGKCLHDAGQDNGRARLVGGSADAGGAWEYGRLEVLIDSIWTVLGEEPNGKSIGRRGAQVACRSLGFDAGAQPLVGRSSPFPGPPGSVRLIRRIECNGSEASLSDCDIEIPNFDFGDDSYSEGVFQFAAALICTNPSGVFRIPHALQVVMFCCAPHRNSGMCVHVKDAVLLFRGIFRNMVVYDASMQAALILDHQTFTSIIRPGPCMVCWVTMH